MLCKSGRMQVFAVGACIAFAGIASAGDTMTLKLTKASPAMAGGVGPAGDFSYAGRDQADDDDVENVTLRYNLGYRRGYYGTGYIYRLPYFRAGYNSAYYGGGYRPYWGSYRPYYRTGAWPTYWGGYRTYYGGYVPAYTTGYYSTSTYCDCPISYSEPVVGGYATYQAPAVRDGASIPSAEQPRYKLPSNVAPPRPMTEPEPPLDRTYQYNGDPNMPIPLPPQQGEPLPKPNKQQSAPKIGQAEGRLVKMPAATKSTKITYPAYGDHLRKGDSEELFIKRPKN